MTIDVAAELSDRTYEGPFDLLLQLILADEVDIHEVSLARIVDAYLVEIERMQAALDLDLATEFLLIAATLVELKARRLLPGPAPIDLDDEFALWEERDLLLARLLECKTFKDVSRLFGALADEAGRSFPRTVGADERFVGLAPDPLAGLTPLRMRDAAIRALTPKPSPRIDLFHVAPIRVSVADAVAELVDELPRVGRITFARLTVGARRAARRDRPLPRRARAVQAGDGRGRPDRPLRRHPHRVDRAPRTPTPPRSPSTSTKDEPDV